MLQSKTIKRISCLACLLYCFAYLILTALGEYEDNVTTRAEVVDPCLCISDLEYWQPRYVSFTRFNGKRYANNLGHLFEPLIALDHAYWHRVRDFSAE